VGDVNESNILVASDARVMIIDTDSAQIKDPSGKVYKCLVGKPEYTAPEISHGSLKDHTRTFETDILHIQLQSFKCLLEVRTQQILFIQVRMILHQQSTKFVKESILS